MLSLTNNTIAMNLNIYNKVYYFIFIIFILFFFVSDTPFSSKQRKLLIVKNVTKEYKQRLIFFKINGLIVQSMGNTDSEVPDNYLLFFILNKSTKILQKRGK